ncbi:MAG: non-homologous end-joining DNA ligase [Pseudomonas sp.]
MVKPLSEYQRKRDFSVTAEPSGRAREGEAERAGGALRFVIQKHAARQLHYDFRLELDGTLKSWAVPKGPSLDPRVKRLAVQVEDHPLDYADFEGRIPAGQYGAGEVIVWDSGTWLPEDADPAAAYRAGKLRFRLRGEKLSGGWALVRTQMRGSGDKEQWLLIKENDAAARPQAEYDIVEAQPDSVLSAASIAAKPARADAAVRRSQHGRDEGKVEVAGVAISNPERVIDRLSGTTKQGLAEFYLSVSEWLLPELRGRPLSLLRAPDGVVGEQFFQRHADKWEMPHIRQLDPRLDPGHEPLLEIDSLQGLLGAVQMGVIELHPWNATSNRIERPDRLILDLDPDPALPWKSVVEATQLCLALLAELGLEAFLKTSGGKGLHLVVPLARRHDWALVKGFAKGISQHLAKTLPERFVAKMGPQNRIGKIFVDYLRNQPGASTVAAFSVRARPGLPVSVPIAPAELGRIEGAGQWTVANLGARLSRLQRDPWAGYAKGQRLTKAMQRQLGLG